jgi:hypothetical protein
MSKPEPRPGIIKGQSKIIEVYEWKGNPSNYQHNVTNEKTKFEDVIQIYHETKKNKKKTIEKLKKYFSDQYPGIYFNR